MSLPVLKLNGIPYKAWIVRCNSVFGQTLSTDDNQQLLHRDHGLKVGYILELQILNFLYEN